MGFGAAFIAALLGWHLLREPANLGAGGPALAAAKTDLVAPPQQIDETDIAAAPPVRRIQRTRVIQQPRETDVTVKVNQEQAVEETETVVLAPAPAPHRVVVLVHQQAPAPAPAPRVNLAGGPPRMGGSFGPRVPRRPGVTREPGLVPRSNALPRRTRRAVRRGSPPRTGTGRGRNGRRSVSRRIPRR